MLISNLYTHIDILGLGVFSLVVLGLVVLGLGVLGLVCELAMGVCKCVWWVSDLEWVSASRTGVPSVFAGVNIRFLKCYL